MAECGHPAVLIVTYTLAGTSTNLARSRVSISCNLPKGHDGAHHSSEHGETWEGSPGKLTTLLRHEDEGS